MTVREVIELMKGKYDFVECYRGTKLHTDYCDAVVPDTGYGDCEAGKEDSLNRYLLDTEVVSYKLMDCEEYNNTILANCGITTSDYGWNGNEKILCILIFKSERIDQ